MAQRRREESSVGCLLPVLLDAILIGVCIAGLVQAPGLAGGQGMSASSRLLMHSGINTQYLLNTRNFWGRTGVSGFLLGYIFPDWQVSPFHPYDNPSIPNPLNGTGQPDPVTADYLLALNQASSASGITDNGIHVRTFSRVRLFEEDKWATIVENFRQAALFAKSSGTSIISIDVEPFFAQLGSDYRAGIYSSYDDNWIMQSLFDKGRRIMAALVTTYPDVQVLLMPDGDYLYTFFGSQTSASNYKFWISFWDGMASVDNPQGIILGDEDMYRVVDGRIALPAQILQNINSTMYAHTQYTQFWLTKASIAPGIWPLGRTYTDKSPRMSVSFFDSFMNLLVNTLVPQFGIKYVWIYGDGAAWWQLSDPTQYGKPLWNPQSQMAPTDPSLPQFEQTIAKYFAKPFTTSTTNSTTLYTIPIFNSSSSTSTGSASQSSTGTTSTTTVTGPVTTTAIPAVPGFSLESIVSGILIGVLALALLRRRRNYLGRPLSHFRCR